MKTHQIEVFGNSVHTRTQVLGFQKIVDGGKAAIAIEIRWDDHCRNGRNSFGITGKFGRKTVGRIGRYGEYFHVEGKRFDYEAGGCIHELVAEHFPEFKHLIKYHLMSSRAPMYFFENSRYWMSQGNLEGARASAVWEDATEADIMCDVRMTAHLEKLMPQFKADLESIGLVW